MFFYFKREKRLKRRKRKGGGDKRRFEENRERENKGELRVLRLGGPRRFPGRKGDRAELRREDSGFMETAPSQSFGLQLQPQALFFFSSLPQLDLAGDLPIVQSFFLEGFKGIQIRYRYTRIGALARFILFYFLNYFIFFGKFSYLFAGIC